MLLHESAVPTILPRKISEAYVPAHHLAPNNVIFVDMKIPLFV
jgi:hypothetical protein